MNLVRVNIVIPSGEYILIQKNGTPYYELWSFSDITYRPDAITPGDKTIITYDKLMEFAKMHSNEMYNKYYGINQDNWLDYIIDLV